MLARNGCSHIETTVAHDRGVNHTPIVLRSIGCSCDHELAATDPVRRISSHRTSVGHVIYYRCFCGHTRLKLWRWTRPRQRAS